MASRLFSEERAQGDWSSLYLILVFMIAALLVILLIKPMFRQSQTIIKPVTQAASP